MSSETTAPWASPRVRTAPDSVRSTSHLTTLTALTLGLSIAAPAAAAPQSEQEATGDADSPATAQAVAEGAAAHLPPSPESADFVPADSVDGTLSEADGEELATEAEDSPHQIFTLEHPGGEQSARWTGTVDPQREVALLVWNPGTEQWEEVSRSTGSAPEQTVLEGPVDESHALDGHAHLAVVAEDPFTTGSAEFSIPGEEEVTGDFLSPEDYDFSIAHVTDTQFLSEGAVDETLDAAAQDRFAEAYRAQMQWIADNAEQRNIAYTGHTGDIIENWMLPGIHSEDQAREEFEFASQMQGILDDAGVPNGILPGNHDNWWGTEGNHLFNEYFPAERYEQASQSWENASYGGPWREGDNSAHYDLFSAGGQEFIAVHLPYGHTHAQRQWAGEILSAFPDRDAIVLSHAYLRASNAQDAAKPDIGGYGGGGLLLREQVVKPHDNVFLVLSGHYHGTAWHVNRQGEGGPVFEMLADYQNYEIDGERNTGFLRLLQFDMDAAQMTVNTYSPRLDEHGAMGYDTGNRSYLPGTDEFTVPVDINTRQTTVSTDQVLLGTDLAEAAEEAETHRETEAPEPTEEPQVPPEQPGPSASAPSVEDVTVSRGEEMEPLEIPATDSADVQVDGLPEGLHLRDIQDEADASAERSIGGEPAEAGVFEVTITVYGDDGSSHTSAFTLTVED